MHHYHVWLEETYQAHLPFLTSYARRIANGNRQVIQDIPDVLQRVFALMYEKREILIHHDNIGGWLTVATRTVILNLMESMNKEHRIISYSLDDDMNAAKREKGEANRAMVLEESARQIADQLTQIEVRIGAENISLLLQYYDPEIDNEALAKNHHMSATTLRKKVSRLCAKLRRSMLALLFSAGMSQIIHFFLYTQ